MNLTRREFIKIIGAGTFYLLSGCITKIPNTKITSSCKMQIFSISLTHTVSDSDNGKEFIIPNFPINCIIKEIRVRSNFTSGQQNWKVAFVDNKDGITPTDIEILCRTAEIFEADDFIFIGDEIARVISSDKIKNIIKIKRGVKGTVPMHHNKDTRMETANNGLRVILYNDISKKLVDSIIMDNIMTWKGVSTFISENDTYIRLASPLTNLKKYDTVCIKDILNTERASIIGTTSTENGTINISYGSIIYMKDPLLNHFLTEIQKQTIYNIPIIYTGEENNLSGIIYVDEKIQEDITVDIDIVVAGQTDALR